VHALAAKFGLWRQRVDHLALRIQELDGTVTSAVRSGHVEGALVLQAIDDRRRRLDLGDSPASDANARTHCDAARTKNVQALRIMRSPVGIGISIRTPSMPVVDDPAR
jgi:hypothetical protein